MLELDEEDVDRQGIEASAARIPRPDGFGEVLFCHATPRDDQEVEVVDSRLERGAEVLGDLPPEVTTVVCGHTRMAFTRLVNTRQIVNPGSVGMPHGRQGAHRAIRVPRRSRLDRLLPARPRHRR